MKNYLVRMSSEDLALMKGLIAEKCNDVASHGWQGSDHEFDELMYRLNSALTALKTPSIQRGKQ